MAHPFFPISFLYNCQKLSKSAVVGSCFFLVGHAFANTYADPSNANAFLPYAPGVSITGLSGDLTTGYGDALIPLTGRNASFFYVDPQALYHNGNDYSAALGLGGRELTDKYGLVGAYVFGDYNHSPAGHSFWFVSPGIERLGDVVDFSANVYIPTGSERVSTGNAFGSEIGDYDSVSFAGHTEYDQLFNTYESVGVGEDVQLGFRLPMRDNPKIYVGGYHFSPKDAQDITGGVARLEVPVNDRLDFDVSEGYDNFAHNTVKVGLAYHFGGRHTPQRFSGDLTQRMVDPIQRNLIAVGGSSHTAQPILRQTKATGDFDVVMDDISFFLPDDTAPGLVTGEGTYEHPYIGLTQSNVDDANSKNNTNFFFNGNIGSYVSTTEIDLMNDSIYGRQSYKGRLFVQPASGDNRPVIDFENSEGGGDNGFVWTVDTGNSDIVVTSIRITGGDGNGDAMILENDGAGQVSMEVDNTDISNTQFLDAISARNTAGGILNLAVNTSTLNNNLDDGIDLNESGQDSVMNVTINYSSLSGNGSDGLAALVHNATNPILNLAINHSALNNNHSGDGAVIDLETNTNAQTNFTIRRSTFNNNNEGIVLLDAHNPSSIFNVTIDSSQLNDNGTGLGIAQIADNNEVFNLKIKNSSFNDNDNGDGINLDLDSVANILIDDSSFNDNNDMGIQVANTGTTNITVKNSTFNENAVDGLYAVDYGSSFNLTTINSTFNGNTQDGLFAQDLGGTFNLTANNSTFNGNTQDGLFAEDLAGTFNLTANNSTFNGNSYGIQANNDFDGTINLTANNSMFNGNHNDGIFAQNFSNGTINLTANNSTFNNNSHDGIDAVNYSNGTFNLIANNSTFNDNTVDGIFAENFLPGVFNLTANNSLFSNNQHFGVEALHLSSVDIATSQFVNNPNNIVP